MWKAILEIISKGLTIFADWPKRKADKAQKNYANWRAGADLRKEKRASRAALVEAVDNLVRRPKSKPK